MHVDAAKALAEAVSVVVVAWPNFSQLEMHPSYVFGSTSSTKCCCGDTAATGHAVGASL